MNQITADHLRIVLIEENKRLKDDCYARNKAIRFENYQVIGNSLDLHRLEFDFPIIFKNCQFESTIRASYAHFKSLAFYGGEINGIDAIGIDCADNLTFATVDPNKRFVSKRRIRLVNGNIGKRLVLNGGIFKSRDWNEAFKKLDSDEAISARGAIDADAIKIGSSLWMDRFVIDKENYLPFEAYGLVTFRNAAIGGRLVARGASLESGVYDGAENGCRFISGLDAFKRITEGVSAAHLDEIEAKYYKELTEQYIQCCYSLDMYNITVGSSVQLSYNFTSKGTIRLSSATLKGKLSMKGAKLYECDPCSEEIETLKQTIWLAESSRLSWGCFDAFKCTIHGSAYLCSVKRVAKNEHEPDFDNKFIAMGRISFSGATINGRFYMGGARIIKSPDTKFADEKKTYSLDLAEATIDLNLLLDHDFVSFGGIRIARCNVGGQVILSSANIFSIEKNTYSINARSAKIDRELRIRNSALIIGISDFQHVEVGSSVDLSSSVFCQRCENKEIENQLSIQKVRSSFVDCDFVSIGFFLDYLKYSVSNSIDLIDSLRSNDNSENEAIYKSRCLDFDNSIIQGNFCLHPTEANKDPKGKSGTCMILGSLFLNRSEIGGILDIRVHKLESWYKNKINCSEADAYSNLVAKEVGLILQDESNHTETGCRTNIYLNNTSVATLRENSSSPITTMVSFKGFGFKTINLEEGHKLDTWSRFMNRSHFGSNGSMWMINKIVEYHKSKETRSVSPLAINKHKLILESLSLEIKCLAEYQRKWFSNKFLLFTLVAITVCGAMQFGFSSSMGVVKCDDLNKLLFGVGQMFLWGVILLILLLIYSLLRYWFFVKKYSKQNNSELHRLSLTRIFCFIRYRINIKQWIYSVISFGKHPFHLIILICSLILISTPAYVTEQAFQEYKKGLKEIDNEGQTPVSFTEHPKYKLSTSTGILAVKALVPYVHPTPNEDFMKHEDEEMAISSKNILNGLTYTVRLTVPIIGWLLFALFGAWIGLRFIK